MTGRNYILRKIQKCATMGARRLGDNAYQTPTGARKQLGLHGLTRQETPTRDTPRAARPNLAQVSVMPQVTQVETRLADKANGPSRALGFFAAFLGPLAPIALNSGAREAIGLAPIHPRYCHSCEVLA